MKYKRIKNTKKKTLTIKEIVINVNPDIIIKGIHRGKEFIGGIKFNIVKGHQLKDDDRKNVATLIHHLLEEEMDETPNLSFCISIDVFSKSFDCAPKSFKTRRKQIEYACEELSIVWDSV